MSAKIHGIAPDFVQPFTPSINLLVKHGDDVLVYRGHVLDSIKTRPKPSVRYEAKEGAFYTLMMVDPDIPLKDSVQDAWNHYMVVNVPGNKVEEGQVLADWIPPAPPKNTGVHHYIWLLLEQPKRLDFSDSPPLSATNFNRVFKFHDFVQKHGLRAKGICFHKTQFDKDVEELYQGWGASANGFHRKDYLTKLVIKQRQYQSM